MQKVVITGHDLTVDQIIAVCREGAEVVLSDESREKILASRQVVNELVEETFDLDKTELRAMVQPVYDAHPEYSDFVAQVDALAK